MTDDVDYQLNITHYAFRLAGFAGFNNNAKEPICSLIYVERMAHRNVKVLDHKETE